MGRNPCKERKKKTNTKNKQSASFYSLQRQPNKYTLSLTQSDKHTLFDSECQMNDIISQTHSHLSQTSTHTMAVRSVSV